MLKRITGTITVILFVFFMLSACGSQKDGFASSESGYSDAQLVVGSVNRFAGVVISGKETKVEKDSGKTIDSLKVSVGDTVKKGDVLFTYDGSQAQYDYEKAEVELDQSRISLDDYKKQRAELEAEKAKAPASEQLSYTIQIQELDTTIRETEYNIELKEKELEKMKNGLGDLKVYSPVSGKIQSINKEDMESSREESDVSDDMDMMDEDEMFDSFQETENTSKAFIVISQTKAFRIKAFINEENMRSLTGGDPVTVRSRVDDSTWQGKVAEIDTDSPQQDQSGYYEGDDSEVTSSSKYPFFVDLDNSDGLMLGQHVYVELYIEAPEVPEEEDGDPEDGFSEEDFAFDEDFGAEEMEDGEFPISADEMPEGDK